MIPKRLFTSFKPNLRDSDECRTTIEKWAQLNPEFEIEYFSDDALGSFFEKYPRDAYRDLVNGTAKADFFRICYIHAVGGIWFDFDLGPFNFLEKVCESNLRCDNLLFDLGYNNISYMLIAGSKGSSLFDGAIKHISQNILKDPRLDGKRNVFPGMDVCGPHAFQEFVKQELSPGGSWLPFPTSLISVQDIDTRRNDYRALQEKVGIKKWQDHR